MKVRGDTKGRIETAALKLFVDKGVAETSIRDIALAVGFSDGALYRHYASKDELVWCMFKASFESYARITADIAASEATSRGKIAAMVQNFCNLFDEDSRLFRFLMLVQHGQLDRVTPEMANPVETVRGVIADAMTKGDIPPGDADLATAMVMGIILQTATFKGYGRIQQPLGAVGPVLAEACWKTLCVPQTSPRQSIASKG
ncbi:MAG TPA: TetR/AcrR family transcriptional regulator [Dongiaceae bacterium]|jgi:AcrR family transcriptional regulator